MYKTACKISKSIEKHWASRQQKLKWKKGRLGLQEKVMPKGIPALDGGGPIAFHCAMMSSSLLIYSLPKCQEVTV